MSCIDRVDVGMRILDYLGASVANLGVTSVAGLLQRVSRLGGAPPMQPYYYYLS